MSKVKISEWKFKRDTAFRKQFFVLESFAHPAKMDAQLLIKIVEEYTQPGETILDPMAGMGTTMLACTLGRHCILVELEMPFCKMMQDNWEEVRMRPQLGYSMGGCQIIQGDARQLEGLLVDKIVTSPPFGEAHNAKGLGVGDGDRSDLRAYSYLKSGTAGQIGDLAYGEIDKIVTSPPRGDSLTAKRKGYTTLENLADTRQYPDNPNNIGNLSYGRIDKIISSPPYSEARSGGGIAQEGFTKDYQKDKIRGGNIHPVGERTYMPENTGANPGQISQLPYGKIDKIVTSPPYQKDAELHGESHEKGRKDGCRTRKPYLDSIITSPPFQEPEIKRKGQAKSREGYNYGSKLKMSSEHPDNISRLAENAYGNIGNLKSDTYLQAMLQVYQQCHAVLRPAGLVILVTKNFIRNKQVIRLDTDTIKLCEQAGFSYLERHYRKLPAQSFWRTIYHKKHPEVEQIKYEDILVFKK